MFDIRITTLDDKYLKTLRNRFLDERHFTTLISGEDADILKPDGSPLLVFRHNVLPANVCEKAFPALKRAATMTDNRPSGGARFQKVKVNGKRSNTFRTPEVMSGIIGYYDRYPRINYCRTTTYTRDNVEGWASVLPFIYAVNDVFRRELPGRYAAQLAAVEQTSPDFVITDTAFTTMTVNRNWRTPAHKDKGDLKEGFGVMSVLSAGKYSGGYLVFPKYSVAVDMRTADVLLADVHEFHGNTPIVGVEGEYDRVSTVMYFRKNMVHCGTAEEELARRSMF